MLKKFRISIARLFASDYIDAIGDAAQKHTDETNRRFAEMTAKMDPIEPLLKEFHGVFSKEYERPEEKLDERGQIGMEMWGYSQAEDPHFVYITEWIMDSMANETLKRAPVTPDRILYGRALLAVMLLFRKEVTRLSEKYKDRLARQTPQGFDETISTDT